MKNCLEGLEAYNIYQKDQWFMQDGSPVHKILDVTKFLNRLFKRKSFFLNNLK